MSDVLIPEAPTLYDTLNLDLDKDVAPDSRARNPTGCVFVQTPSGGMWMEPVACVSCSREGGLVPQQNIEFICWVCDPCADKGYTRDLPPGTFTSPDEHVWLEALREQVEKLGRPMTGPELVRSAESSTSPLATLLNRKGR